MAKGKPVPDAQKVCTREQAVAFAEQVVLDYHTRAVVPLVVEVRRLTRRLAALTAEKVEE